MVCTLQLLYKNEKRNKKYILKNVHSNNVENLPERFLSKYNFKNLKKLVVIIPTY